MRSCENYALVEEKDSYRVSLPKVSLKGSEIEEEIVELKVDRGGAVLEGSFRSVDDAVYTASAALLKAADEVEMRLDKLELLLESDKRVKLSEIHENAKLVYKLYSHALCLDRLARRLRSAGLVRPGQIKRLTRALRRAEALRHSLLSLRLLHLTQAQHYINLTTRSLTILSLFALPITLISIADIADSPFVYISASVITSLLLVILFYAHRTSKVYGL